MMQLGLIFKLRLSIVSRLSYLLLVVGRYLSSILDYIFKYYKFKIHRKMDNMFLY